MRQKSSKRDSDHLKIIPLESYRNYSKWCRGDNGISAKQCDGNSKQKATGSFLICDFGEVCSDSSSENGQSVESLRLPQELKSSDTTLYPKTMRRHKKTIQI